ncbi:MAG: hypothetical protein IKY95_02240 [Bacteroidales bacterium]|nr:hypothetical protein [Bacteroidales bacterium]MBR5300651.1 hypothetical protein [Bacteroidales bacterium]
MKFYEEDRIFDIDEEWRQKIIQSAHRYAFDSLTSKVDGFMEGSADKTKTYLSYRSSFMDSLIKHYYSHSELVRRSFKRTFTPLLERLAQKGASEYMVETNPLTLTIFLKNGAISFTDSEEGIYVGVDDYRTRVSHWNEDMVDLLEIVLDECQKDETILKIDRMLIEQKTELMKNDILIATVKALIQKKLPKDSYTIKSNCITVFKEVFLFMDTAWGYISLVCPFEVFEETLDREIKKTQASQQK